MMRPIPPRSPASGSPQPLAGQDPRQDTPLPGVEVGSARAGSPRSVLHRSSASEQALRAAAADLLGLQSAPPVDGQDLTQDLTPALAGSKRTSAKANLLPSDKRARRQHAAPDEAGTALLWATKVSELIAPRSKSHEASAASSLTPCVSPSISDLSEDLVDEVVGHLPASEISAMTSANRALREAIAPRLRSLKVAHDVSHIRTLDQLREALGEIGLFARPGLRTEPLRQLMLRIGALPLGDRAQAMIGFREAANSLAAQDRPPEPPRLENILMHGGPHKAVNAGENVAVVARVFGMSRPLQIRGLELRAIRSQEPNSASACLLAGGNVREVADQFGITTPESLLDLELITIRSEAPKTAGAALRAGQSVQEIAHRFGITTPGGIRDLEDLAIRLAH